MKRLYPLLIAGLFAACSDNGTAAERTGATAPPAPTATAATTAIQPPPQQTTATAAPTTEATTTTVEMVLPVGSTPVVLDPAEFTADIDNPFSPMAPGTRWTYSETDGSDTFTVVVIATDQTKLLANGITARVVRDTVSKDGEIVEDTFDWYAQDSHGNVWYMGEDTAEFEGGKVASTKGSWEAGVNGAQPGIALLATPQVGAAYRQEYLAGQAEDNGKVLSIDESAEVPFGSFTGVQMTEDTSALETTLVEHKYYAPGVGLVLTIDTVGGGREELLSVDTAPPGAGTGPLGAP